MTALAMVDVLAAVAIIVLRLRLSPRAEPSPSDSPVRMSDSSVNRARATIGWVEGSRADWDRHVRPILARELTELLRARRDPGAPDRQRTGERMFGAELWALVDPARPFTSDPGRPGPGRDALTRILDRLERL